MKTKENAKTIHDSLLRRLRRAEAQRDELLELCKIAIDSNIDGSYVVASNWWIKMESLIKSITKS